MTLTQILDASALAALVAQAGWIGLLYRRMGRLRVALEGAGDVIGQLDEASCRLDNVAGGIVQKVRDGIGEVDSKLGACRRLVQELSTASRQAEEVATRLDLALRQNRKLQSARAAAPPRELVEPLGLAERLAGRPMPALTEPAAVFGPPLLTLPAAPEALAPAIPEEPPLRSVLAAELLFASPATPVPEARTIRVKLD
ncbi:MAG TPA: hypothetical protein VNR89_24020 [Roseomonas sp.]|nr:hypothetical protein [Roseomonas sp.]